MGNTQISRHICVLARSLAFAGVLLLPAFAMGQALDSDGDGVPDVEDSCPELWNPFQADMDSDGLGDLCDPDIDGDGVPNEDDNCICWPNADQANEDGDHLGDVCEVCPPFIEPGPEVCDGIDNDCDGEVDEEIEDTGRPCDTGEPGLCSRGSTDCRNGELVCVRTGVPTPEVCDGVDNDCDGLIDGGAECDGEQVCDGGECRCPDGLTLCNNLCVDPQSDAAHCGVCGNACEVGFVCSNGACKPECDPGLTQCGDGCADLMTSLFHCGECAKPCRFDHGLAICEAGQCRPGGCDDGWVDLDADPANGCECRLTNGGEEACDGLDNDCDGEIDEGDPGSGQDCDTGEPGVCGGGTTICRGGLIICEQTGQPGDEVCDGLDNDCDGAVDEGDLCDGDLRCREGLCQCPDPSLTPCGDRCVDTDADADHCGGCGQACPDGQVCTSGHCGDECEAGLTRCGDDCVDLDASPLHCGQCDRNCFRDHGIAECAGGECRPGPCFPGFVDLDGDAANGCECQITFGGVEQCDGADNDCDGEIDEGNPGAGEACDSGEAGVCAAGTTDCRDGGLVCVGTGVPEPEICDGIDSDCDGFVDNGALCEGDRVCHAGRCECRGDGLFGCADECVDLRSDPLNCGDCGRECPDGQVCALGECEGGCPDPLVDCNRGCVDLLTDPRNCGICGFECIFDHAIGHCLDARCIPECEDGWVDLDTEPGNGCECGLTNDGVETCDGIDNDCDGQVDEGNPGGGEACDSGMPGGCALGAEECQGGQLVCVQVAQPTDEACNGADDDCDGLIDDAAPCEGQLVCIDGACRCEDPALTRCGSRCIDILTDLEHCGGCGESCGDGFACLEGECVDLTIVLHGGGGCAVERGATAPALGALLLVGLVLGLSRRKR